MDYTLSDGYATHIATGHRLHQLDQPVPTAVTEKDMNSVLWSLMEIINSAGLTPQQFNKDTPATYQVLRNAMQAQWGTAGNPALNGYKPIGHGFVLQWGRASVPLGVSTAQANVTFPIAFPNICLSFVASIGVNAGDYDFAGGYRSERQECSFGAPSTTGVEGQVFIDNLNTDGRVVQWIAIGY